MKKVNRKFHFGCFKGNVQSTLQSKSINMSDWHKQGSTSNDYGHSKSLNMSCESDR